MLDEYIEFAVRMQIPDAMTPLLHMDRDLGQLATILGIWCARDHRATVEKYRRIADETADRKGNR